MMDLFTATAWKPFGFLMGKKREFLAAIGQDHRAVPEECPPAPGAAVRDQLRLMFVMGDVEHRSRTGRGQCGGARADRVEDEDGRAGRGDDGEEASRDLGIWLRQ